MKKMPNIFGRVASYLRVLMKFIGPGFMIAVGYFDPGNWATDMEGGSRFGYRLLFIILLSNIIAIFLQNLTIRLGTISGLDLASASRKVFPLWINMILYVMAEIAIVATDLAEVIGSAIALNLLFPKLPLPAGIAITAADVFIVLLLYNDEANNPDSTADSASVRVVRYFEFFVMILVFTVAACFIVELTYSNVVAVDVLKGYVPTKEIFTDSSALYVSIGIIGATVMPHNLYLHAFIVQARCREWRNQRPKVVRVGDEGWALKRNINTHVATEKLDEMFEKQKHVEEKNEEIYPVSTGASPNSRPDHSVLSIEDYKALGVDEENLRIYLDKALKCNLHYGLVDLGIALLIAFFVNCAILIVAGANFYYGPHKSEEGVEDLFSAHALLEQYIGPPAAVVFALALLLAGQSSTLTATLAGQVVMSGFLGMTTRPWVRRVVTRLIAIVPAMIAACSTGRTGLNQMLVGSQVALSVQLPFCVLPLLIFTAKKSIMKVDLVVEHKEPRHCKRFTVPWLDRFIPSAWLEAGLFRSTKSTDATKDVTSNGAAEPEKPNDGLVAPPRAGLHVEIKELPKPLVYQNGWIVNILAGIICLLLICLNVYMIVTTIQGE
ncbi:natural resistance-associated macrophage protein-domain-containing protein [Radiomyces spectabilis]|uniref:natural resistance-associated macrophage protein-domain-containing protein n=1 Tax=Radiomyces spectabilis TaxID=64574 RepID=UPI00221F7E9A|nr:natural resistance-associated macrophage protein-domain-containing protein [Radiomyces spectabilis]KAI8377869.1 natural resistance-associated macrophage protein-domain-containing protein [Radiomyces spectabilis]